MALPISEQDAIFRIQSKSKGTIYKFVGFATPWKGVSTKLLMHCEVHGEWKTTSYNKFVNDGRSCPACSNVKPLTREEVETNVTCVLQNESSSILLIGLGKWRGCKTVLHLKCKEHGEWKTTNYNKFMMGRRCPGCAKRGFDSTTSATLYILKRIDENAIKIGIANNFNLRMHVLRKETPFGFDIVGTLHSTGAFVQLLEKTLHKIHKATRSANYSGFDGCSEWFVLDEKVRFSLNLLGIQWDDGNYSCHAQRDLKRVGQLYAKLD